MQDQLKIIREALEFLCLTNSAHDEALTALTQLEAMVGEPVAWQRRMKPVWGDRDYLWSPWEECSEGTAEDCWKTPLLHEWAYEARALYTAVPVDQRPRAKEIGEADLDPDEGDPVTLWAEIWRLREAVKGPDGYATWQDAATAERIRRVRAESKHAAPLAQQPQEIEVQCPVCNHKFYEWPNDKQPQAEAVPQWTSCRCFDEVSKRLCADKNRCSQVVAASAATQQAKPNSITFYESPTVEVLRIGPDGKLYWRGREIETDAEVREAMLDVRAMLNRAMTPQQAEAVPIDAAIAQQKD